MLFAGSRPCRAKLSSLRRPTMRSLFCPVVPPTVASDATYVVMVLLYSRKSSQWGATVGRDGAGMHSVETGKVLERSPFLAEDGVAEL